MDSDETFQSSPSGRRVAIVTDSTTYLPQSLIDSLGVHQVSLYVGWDGDLQPERDYVDLARVDDATLTAVMGNVHRPPVAPKTDVFHWKNFAWPAMS